MRGSLFTISFVPERARNIAAGATGDSVVVVTAAAAPTRA